MEMGGVERPAFACWGIVEVMGRQQYAGHISEEVIAGHAFLRVDVPEVRDGGWNGPCKAYTKFLGSSSIYAITPTTESLARAAAEKFGSRPVTVIDLDRMGVETVVPQIAAADPTESFYGEEEEFHDED